MNAVQTIHRSPVRFWQRQLLPLLSLLIALVVLTPVISIVVIAAQPVDDLWPHLLNYVLPRALADTALLLAGVGAVALVIGAGTAWIVSAYDFPGRTMLLWLLPLPLAIPTYIGAYVYVDLLEPLGLIHRMLTLWLPPREALQLLPTVRSLPGAIAVIGLVLYPYVYLSARAMFQTQSADIAEAAKLLGAGRWQRLFRVALPMARPALAVGLALVLLETLNDIGASEYLGIRTLTVSIFTTWLNRGSLAGAAQLAALMLVVIAALVLLERYGRKARSFAASADSPHLAQRPRLRGAQAVGAWLACAVPVLLGFGVPFAFLIHQTFRRGLLQARDPAILQALLQTVTLAAIATALILVAALIVTLAQRMQPTALTYASLGTAQAGYAVPGLVLALGLLSPLVLADALLNGIGRVLLGSGPGLLLAGSGAALVIAYVIRFLAVGVGLTQSGFAGIPRDYDDSARVSGAGAWVALRKIHLPLLRPALWGGAILVFVDCLKELPATLLLRPLNVETLSTTIYQYASRGSFEDGALAALLIVAASIVPVIWLTRFSDVPNETA